MSLRQKRQELSNDKPKLAKYIATLVVDARHTEFWELIEDTVRGLIEYYSALLFTDVKSISDNAAIFESRGSIKALRHLMQSFDQMVRDGTQEPPPGIGEETDVAHQR